ncbi:MAG: cobalamin biosynthesis protein CbiM [Clostridiales bacterium 41_21_two_genomes]|nr:MAG: cobalamin biosynthesis protein CbiM [Clostridiales bacterium 41_21_two_genomes]
MHIPENYLSPSTCAVMTAAMLPVWGYSIHKIKTEIPKSKMPLLGIGAAFSFLGMMFNVPLPGGTTGHAVGGTLIAILTGSPAAGCMAVSIALLIQALLFGDGGILAFGANCFNMAFILPYLGFFLYKLLLKKTGMRKLSAAIGSYIGINAAAFCAAVEFGIQPLLFKNAEGQALYCPYPLSVSIPAMMMDAVPDKTAFKPLYILMAVLIVLTPLGLLATGTAWGEWGADEIAGLVSGGSQLGYTPSGMTNGFELSTLFPDYSMSGLPEWTGYILSAIVGVALLVIIFKIISSMMKEKVDFKKKAA